MEKDGKIMWNEIVKANCSLDRSSAVTSMEASASAKDSLARGQSVRRSCRSPGFDHVERKAFGHLGAGGIASSVRATTASTSAGPS
jgi:hypothetical protein